MKFSDFKRATLFIAAFLLSAVMNSFIVPGLDAQTQSGAAFLKVLPGARQQGLAGSLTGAIDETYALYANPGAVGFLREWQWSASYTEWIADIFNASLVYGRQLCLRSPLSNRANFALGIHYQGIREFDSSRGAASPASARDILVAASLGSPVTALSRNLALGLNVKYFRSELAQFTASAIAFDFGLLYRTPRFRLSRPGGFFDYGIVSGGVAVTHLGTSMKFFNSSTPLPRTLRAGLALNLGSHDGLQVQLAVDYKSIRDEDNRFSFGAEVTNLFSPFSRDFGRFVDLRGGYNFDRRFLSKFSVGLSVRLDDYMLAPLKSIAPKNSALRIDMGIVESNEFFSPIYRGSITHQPILPESFEFIEPAGGIFKSSEAIKLSWHATRDPDLYDDVGYLVFVAKDSFELNQLIKKTKANEIDIFRFVRDALLTRRNTSIGTHYSNLYKAAKNDNGSYEERDKHGFLVVVDSMFAADQSKIDYILHPGFAPGEYYWTVMAYDQNHHIRFAETSGRNMNSFRVETDLFTLKHRKPDLTLKIRKSVKSIPPLRLTVDLPPITFAPDSSNLNEEAKRIFSQWVDFIKLYPQVTFEISGHSDNTGPSPTTYRKKYNKKLSQRRAQTIVNALVQQGIDAGRLKAVGYGESTPVASGNSPKDWAKNRRVEIKLLHDNRPAKKVNVAIISYQNSGIYPSGGFSVTIYDAKEIPEALKNELINGHFSSLGANGHDFSDILRMLTNVTIPNLESGESATIEVPCDEERLFIIAVIDKDNRVEETNETNNWIIEKTIVPEVNIDLTLVTSSKIAFAFDSYELTEASKDLLEKIISILSEAPSALFEIAGHSDSRGPDEYNMHLSLLRAQSVKDYLISNGIDAQRLIAQGYGESKPVDSKNDFESWSKNRRVEIKLID